MVYKSVCLGLDEAVVLSYFFFEKNEGPEIDRRRSTYMPLGHG